MSQSTSSFPILKSSLSTKSPSYNSNRNHNLAAVENLHSILETTHGGANSYLNGFLDQIKDRLVKTPHNSDSNTLSPPPPSNQNHTAKRLHAMQRINLVLDEDSPFLELCQLAGYKCKGVPSPGASVIAGIGLIHGTECIVTANVATVRGGALNAFSVKKMKRISTIALENRLPVVSFVETAGADLTQQDTVFHEGGGSFRDLAVRSKAGIPTICVVFGSSTAGGAYSPGMSDYTIFVKDKAKVFLAGPPLVKMSTGEVVDDESLGGARMHATVSGLADYFASDEYDGIRLARQVVQQIQWKKETNLPEENMCGFPEEPLYSPDELLGVLPASTKTPFDVREIIARIVDGSRFAEFKQEFGPTMVTGFASIHGIEVGILGNNGVIFSSAAQKATQFIHLCNQRDIPLVFLQNITGFMVGKEYEQGGIIKHGAQLINAVSNSGVPAITIILQASYGAGNYAMAGRAYKPRFLFSFPNSKCSVMGSTQLGGVMDIVARQRAAKQKQKLDEKVMAQRKKNFLDMVEKQSSAYYTSARVIDDGIIDPRDTRTVLGLCLSVIHSSKIEGQNHFGVSRM